MSYRLCAAMGLLSVAASLAGCASSLDFDRVSSGSQGMDAGARAADAGSVETTVRTVSTAAFDSSAPVSPEDAGGLGTSRPDARAHASEASSIPAAASSDAGSSPVAASSDAGSSRDAAAADAGSSQVDTAVTDPAAFSCANLSPKPYFCDDFEILELSGHWSEVVVQPTDPLPGGWIGIDGNAARAGFYSLLAEVNEGLIVCDNCIALRAGSTLPNLQGPTKLTAEFDVRLEQIDPNDGRRIMLFQFWWGTPETGFTEHSLQLESSGGSAWTALVEIASDAPAADSDEEPEQAWADHQWLQTPVLSEWVHVVYALDVQDALGTANVARLTMGDLVLFDGPLSFALRTGKASMELGIPWVSTNAFSARDTSERWRVRYDNVVVRHLPNEPR